MAPRFVSRTRKNPCQLSLAVRWQLASRRRLFEIACLLGASKVFQWHVNHYAIHCQPHLWQVMVCYTWEVSDQLPPPSESRSHVQLSTSQSLFNLISGFFVGKILGCDKKWIHLRAKKLREVTRVREGSDKLEFKEDWFKSSVLRSALMWDITRLRMVIPYRPFGTTYGSNLRGSRISIRLVLLLDPWRWDWQFVPKRRYGSTILRCVISQKSAVSIHNVGKLKSRIVLCLITLVLCRVP